METNALPPNLNPSPKTRFRQHQQHISEHRSLIESGSFSRAADFALLEYQAQLGVQVSENPQMASVAGFKMAGAQEFLQTFKLLSEQPHLVARTTPVNLNHKV